MSELIEGDDGLPAQEVGLWAKEKHELLAQYVDISRGARAMYLPPKGNGGASYIDLFCGPGRARVRETGEWIDGSAVVAWKKSQDGGAPFSRVIVADANPKCADACEQRLRALGAPVISIVGEAKTTAFTALQRATAAYGLNFAFIDPFNLKTLDFEIFKQLSRMKRIDIMVHVSTMDLQRNLDSYMASDESAFDVFAPGWRDAVGFDRSRGRARGDVFDYWKKLVAETDVDPSGDVKLISGTRGQRLYWLLLAARHELAKRFWSTIASDKRQGSLF